MVNRGLSVGDNSLINGSINVTRSLRIQKDNLKCKKQDPKSLRWQPQASNDILSNSNKTKSFTVFHQNVRGAKNKSEELISFLSPDFPQVICLTEHHLKHNAIDIICMNQYKLGTKFCKESIRNGGVSIFVHDTLQCTNINLDEFCKEQDTEACAVRSNLSSSTMCIISIYRSPTGNFLHFLHTVDSILNFLHKNTIAIIIYSDFNINYLNDNEKKVN